MLTENDQIRHSLGKGNSDLDFFRLVRLLNFKTLEGMITYPGGFPTTKNRGVRNALVVPL